MRSNHSYKDLLKSTKWTSVRQEVLRRDGFECQKCQNQYIIDHSLKGPLTTLTRKLSALEVLNQSDPRFEHAYLVEFSDANTATHNQIIYSPFAYSDEKLESFANSIVYYQFGRNLTFMDSLSDKPYLTCIEDYSKSENKWFYVKRLEVHHLYYDKSKMPWDYPLQSLKTLCWICHREIHS